MPSIILSHYQAAELLSARSSRQPEVLASPDLGLSRVPVRLTSEGVEFPAEQPVPWPLVESIADNEKNCFVIDGQGSRKLLAYSEATRRAYGLFPTPRAPALLLSGVTMHRIKGIDPVEDTERKIQTVAPLRGKVLDTCTGLGYTAIAAARQGADHVTTIELDPEVLGLARFNPWSRELFDNPKITQLVGDGSVLVKDFPDRLFNFLIHDPPMIKLSGEMFSTVLYEHFYRLLCPGGRLFHYIGDPETPGAVHTTRGVTERLRRVGFRRVEQRPEAFGVLAVR